MLITFSSVQYENHTSVRQTRLVWRLLSTMTSPFLVSAVLLWRRWYHAHLKQQYQPTTVQYSHKHQGHDINKTTNFLALFIYWYIYFNQLAVQTSVNWYHYSIKLHYEVFTQFHYGSTIVQISIYNTNTFHSWRLFYPLSPPPTIKQTLYYVQHISCFGADINARICTCNNGVIEKNDTRKDWMACLIRSVLNGRKMNILHIYSL
jgi:hypothetical protein